jgi:hypothetical protein
MKTTKHKSAFSAANQKPRKLRILSLIVFAYLFVIYQGSAGATGTPISIYAPGFNAGTIASFQLNGSAQGVDNMLRLTSAEGGLSGSAFWESRIYLGIDNQISENIYMQYFLGYANFTNEAPFDASLFVDFRKRLGIDQVNAINERIVALKARFESIKEGPTDPKSEDQSEDKDPEGGNHGRIIFDATACPQDIAYPTDAKNAFKNESSDSR